MTVRRLAGYLAPYRGALMIAGAAMIVLAIATGMYPVLLDLLTNRLIEGASPEGPGRALEVAKTWAFFGFSVEVATELLKTHLIAFFAGVVLIKAGAQAVRYFVMGWISERVVQDLRVQLFSHLIRQETAFFETESSGQWMSRLMHDLSLVERATTNALPILVGDVLKVVALGVVSWVEYPALSLVSLVVFPLALLPIVQFGRLLKGYGHRGQAALGQLGHRITETLGGIRVVKAYGREAYERARFHRAHAAYLRIMVKGVFVRAVQTPVMELVGVLALIVTLGYATDEVAAGRLRPSEVVGFLLALILLYEPIKALGRLNGIVMPGLAAAERTFDILDRPPGVSDRPGAEVLGDGPMRIRFDAVHFRYAQDRPWVLRNINLELSPGRALAVIGPSGSGKSTLAHLILRLYDVTEGQIWAGDKDVRDVTRASLREKIAFVAQDTYLFNESVFDNIAYGLPGATREAVMEAARRAYAHEFIEALPEGYATRVGERGGQLSGGQRQRIAVARAFLRDAPILILDEATQALDPDSADEVERALDDLLVGRTALIIQHRRSRVRRAHEAIVLEAGEIVERGDHATLMAMEGRYAAWIRAQSIASNAPGPLAETETRTAIRRTSR